MEEKLKQNSVDWERLERLKDLLLKLKRVSGVYPKASEEQKEKLFNACSNIFDELVGYGYKREFLESLVIGGKDFLESLGEVDLTTEQSAQLIFK